jgi:hypothetical protein
MKSLCVVALLCLATLPALAVVPDECSTDVLPDGPKNCRYRHIKYTAFSYSGGELSVRWPGYYTVSDVRLTKNWQSMFRYEPGSRVQIDLSPTARYDLVARFTDRRSGETFLGLTPVSCRSKHGTRRGKTLTPAPFEGCTVVDTQPRSCSVQTDVECADSAGNPTGKVSAECSGDSGTCSDECSDTETACCTATRTHTETSSDGTQTSLTSIEEKQQDCD